MDEIALEVTSREILGKKVRFLRRQGVTPVHLFGHGIESMSLQCDTATLRHALAEAGRTRLISLKIASEKEPRNVVVREVQTEPRTGESLHVDFYQVKMTEQVRVEVPIVLVGESPALKFKENMLVLEQSRPFGKYIQGTYLPLPVVKMLLASNSLTIQNRRKTIKFIVHPIVYEMT